MFDAIKNVHHIYLNQVRASAHILDELLEWLLSILLTGVDFIVDESGVVVAIEIAASPIDLHQGRAAFFLCCLIGHHQPISLEIHIVERQVGAPEPLQVEAQEINCFGYADLAQRTETCISLFQVRAIWCPGDFARFSPVADQMMIRSCLTTLPGVEPRVGAGHDPVSRARLRATLCGCQDEIHGGFQIRHYDVQGQFA
jgi:hypothetical protein